MTSTKDVFVLIEVGLIIGVYSSFELATKAAADYSELTPDKLLPWDKTYIVVEEWTSRYDNFHISKLTMNTTPYTQVD